MSLQLLAIAFILSSAASNATGNSSLAPARLFDSLLAALVQQPGKTLSTTCTGVAVIQVWYGLWAQGLRKAHAAGPVARPAGERAPKKGFTGAFSEMLTDAKHGKAPQLDKIQSTKGKSPFAFDLNVSCLPKPQATEQRTRSSRADRLTGVDPFLCRAAVHWSRRLGDHRRGDSPARFRCHPRRSPLHVRDIASHCAAWLPSHRSSSANSLLLLPPHSRVKETFLLCFLVAQLAVAPIALAVPYTERYTWLRLFSSIAPANDLELALLAPALGTVLGCWLGAVPIPLDWDRPWQAWPTTCVLGAVMGHFVGSAVAVVLVSRNAAVGGAEEAAGEGEAKKDK